MTTTNTNHDRTSTEAASAGQARSATPAVLAVPLPAPGGAASVAMVPGSQVQLPFNPGEATASRSGNDLTFELDNGGSVTISGFFVVEGGNELPVMVLPGGDAVPASVALAGGDLDLSTAAGPAATATPPGGGTNYADDAGNLINGIDRLGSLGTDYWGRETEYGIEQLGIIYETPGGDFGLGFSSDLGAMFGMAGGVYEDGLPFQHQGDRDTFVPGQITFNFEPTGTTVVTGIHLSGFHAGTVIYYGDPSDPNTRTVTVSGPDQVLDFTEDDFANGVYLVPPANSDADMNISAEVDLRAESSGLEDSISGNFTVRVDAVADQPELGEDLSAIADSSGHVSDKTSSEEEYKDGYNETKSTVSAGETGGGAKVTVTVSAVYDDYEDGSERHFLLVQTHDSLELDPDSLPDGYTYVGTIEIDGVIYHQIEVDNSVIQDGNGEVTLPIEFETTGDAKEKDGEDEHFDLKVGAYAEEDVDPSGEIDLNNNQAHVVTEDGKGVTTDVDVVNSTLTVKAGWASEGNNASKHVGGSGPGYNGIDHEGMDGGEGVDENSTKSDGAPISIGLEAGPHQDGSVESITSVELTFDQGRGDLCINGEPVYNGMEIPGANGVSYTVSVDADTGAVTITVTNTGDDPVTSLDELNLTYRPDQTGDQRYNDEDVNMHYKVNVSNEAGAKGVYEGDTEIVIDAVADKPLDVGGAGVDYKGEEAAAPGQTVELSFKATFPDTDGSETHTIFIRVDGNNGSASHEYGDSVISGERLAEINGIAGSNVLTPGGEYLELTIPPLADFNEDGTYTFEELGITVTYNSADGSYTVSGVEVTMPDREDLTGVDDQGNTSMGFDTVGWAHENADTAGSDAENNEHDLGNNDAFTKGKGTVAIAGVGAGEDNFNTSGGIAFENDQPHNNRPDAGDETGNNTAENGGVALDINWGFDDPNEYVSEILISVPTDAYGNPVGYIMYNGERYDAVLTDDGYVISIPVDADDAKTGLSDVVFVPDGHSSGKVDLGVSAVVKDSQSTDSVVVEADGITVDVDAVANRSGKVVSEARYDDGNSAVGTGDPVYVKVSTTFADNDGSERHYVLVQQQPNWQGEYSVEYYDLDGDGVSEAYFKVPVPVAPPEGSGEDYAGDAYHLSYDQYQQLLEDGEITVNGVTIRIPDGPDGEWQVEAVAELTPPDLDEDSHTLKTGSLAEEYNIDQSTENRGEDYKDNNVAMRPGNDVSVEVNNTAGIKVVGDFLYEAGEEFAGGDGQNGLIHILPSSDDDSFYGDLTVSIPDGHGDLYYNGELLTPGGGANPDGTYPVALEDKDGNPVNGSLKVDVTEDGQFTVTFVPEDQDAPYTGIDLEARLNGDDYSDKDIKVSVEGNLVNDKSGQHTSGVGGKGEVMVDAVAQKPGMDETQVPDHEAVVPGGHTGVKVTIAAAFEDVDDGSEDHFLLIEAKPGHSYTFTILVNGEEETHTIDVTSGWPTVLGPDGTVYYKIPVSTDKDGNPIYDSNGKASVEVEIKVTQPYFGDDTSDIRYGAMSEDSAQDGEKTYDNNIAFSDEGSLSIDVDLGSGGSHPVSVDVAYENNTPNAHKGEPGEEYADIHLPKDADEITLTWDPKAGSVIINGQEDDSGSITLTRDQLNDPDFMAQFKVAENYDDSDLSLGYEIKGGPHDGAKGDTPIYVDAVAQQGAVDEVSAHRDINTATGQPYAAVGEGEVVLDISLSGLLDQDGSSDYYVLIEAKPGWECDGAEMVLIGGKAYFRVPVDADSINDDGTVDVKVTLKTPEAGADGTVRESLEVGSMVVDTPTDDGELTMDNNVAVNVDGKVDIYKSVAQTSLVLDVGAGYEDQLGEPALITVSNVGDNDEVTELHFSVDSGKGEFVYDGETLQDGEYNDFDGITITVKTVDGKTEISITAKPPATGLSEQDLKNYINDKLGLQPADGNTSSEDLEINWGYTVRDKESGDTATKADEEKPVIIDAVAHKPEVSDYEINYGDGRQAALPGESVTINALVTFTDLAAETNFVLVQFLPGWEVDGITLTVNGETIHYTADEIKNMELFYPNGSAGGGVYYKVPVGDLDPNTDSGKYTVEVEVDVKVPETGITGDSQTNLGIGGAAVDSYGDGETSLSNNVDSDTASGDGIGIGIVDSTGVEAGTQGDAPEEGAGNRIFITIEPVGGENDVITGLTLTNPDPDSGSFWYNGVELFYDEDGRVTLPPEGAGDDWVFDSSKLEFRPNDTFGGQLDIKVEATVSDARSGDSKGGFETNLDIEVTPVATPPIGLTANGAFDPEDGGVWTLTLSAVFADYDGSEEHFFLVKIPDGLTLEGDYTLIPATGPDGSDGWYRIDVSGTEEHPSLDLSFRADSGYNGEGVQYHAGASETANGNTDWAAIPPGGNEAAPAGDFDYRTEYVNGTGSFLLETEDLLINGGDGNDTITGGHGNDTIHGGSGNDEIHAGSGDNLIIGGEGNDTMYGGDGTDVFFWDKSHFGTDGSAVDTVYDLEYNKDVLSFQDVFGDDMDFSSVDNILSFLSSDKGSYQDNQLTLEGASCTITAEFGDNGLSLNINCGNSQQTIEVNFGGSGSVYQQPADATEAAEILKNLISEGVY